MYPSEPRSESSREGSLYRAVWRWHFYAGLAVLPLLLWLAITGGLYLYKAEIEHLVYRSWTEILPAGVILPLDQMVEAVERQSGNQVIQIVKPPEATSSWRMTLVEPSGTRRLAFVDPYGGRILGSTFDGGVMQRVRDLHSLIITGPLGNVVVEMVAGWAILLVLSGFFLWWPRRDGPWLRVRGRPSGRTFWRDLHASVGALAGAIILFLALTGMPWTGFWGKELQSAVASQGMGRPKIPTASKRGHDHGEAARRSLPWSLQEATLPSSGKLRDVGPDRIARTAAARGLTGPWTMSLPSAPGAPYLISAAIVRADDARVLAVDGSTGAVIHDAAYARFGTGAKLIEWGIATHQGQQYGEPNRLAMLGGCLSIIILALTAPVMWWKRRRFGRLAAPPRPDDAGKARIIIAVMLAIGCLFPLTGASMLVVLVADRLRSILRPPARV